MKISKRWIAAGIIALAMLIGVVGGVIIVHTGDMPQVTALEEYKPSATTRIFADDGQILAEFYMENRFPVTLSQVPDRVIKAFLATEDPRFYKHSGIDVTGVMRALLKNASSGKLVQGGSSITQQLAKILFLKPDRTYSRKIKEAVLSLQIERHYSKDEILQMYLNQVYLGSGAYGVEAASRRYFGKPVSELDLAQAATIAGLPAAPNKYNPVINLERSISRRHHVLGRMVDEGFITQAEMDAADKEVLVIAPPAKPDEFKAPYFVEYVRQRLEAKYGSSTLYRGGLNVYTTLNLKMQEIAEEAMKKDMEAIDRRHPRKDGKTIQGAFLAIEPHSGYIKAMIGGRDYKQSEFNRSSQALRQPGSVFKPIVYTAAVDTGYTPDDIIMDTPVSYPGARPGVPWRPTNYEGKFEGPITLRRALAHSVNVVAVKLASKVGVPKVIEYARKMGITSALSPYLPMALGASDVNLMEMTAAFAVFNNQGVYNAPTSIEKITDRSGALVEESLPLTVQSISPGTAALMTDMLAGVIKFGTGYEAKSLGRSAAGKTGTTSDYHDAWFIGYIPSMVCGVWVGYDDHKPIGAKETGARAALPVWLGFMKGYVKEFNVPEERFPTPPVVRMVNTTTIPPDVKDVVPGDAVDEAPQHDEAVVPSAGQPDLKSVE